MDRRGFSALLCFSDASNNSSFKPDNPTFNPTSLFWHNNLATY